MPRIRTIKPEFPQSESVGRLSRDARLLFIQLWTIVDDYGRSRASPRLLAGQLYPYDDDAQELLSEWLSELENNGFIRLYHIDGNSYLDIPTWAKHQRIDNAGKSNIPEFRGDEDTLRREPPRTAASLGEPPLDLGPRKGPRNRKDYSPISNKKNDEIDESFLAWYAVYPRHEARGQALQAWKRALPKASLDTLMAGVRRYAEACKQKETRYIRLPSTWLNGEGWLDEEGKHNAETDRTTGPGIGYIVGPAHPADEYDGNGVWIPELAAQKQAQKDRDRRPLEPIDGAGEISTHGIRIRSQSDPIQPPGHECGHGRTVAELGDDRGSDRALPGQIQASDKFDGTMDRADGSRQSGGESPPGPARPAVERKRLISVTPEDRARLMAAELIEPSAHMALPNHAEAPPEPVRPDF